MGRKSSNNHAVVSSAALVKEKGVDAWNFDAFLAHIAEIHFNKNDIRFMFMLGAGASVSSGIPTGYTLAKGWLEDLYARYGNEEGIGAWLSSTPFSDLPDLTFENCGKYYSQIYSKRFGYGPAEGYAEINRIVADSTPSVGYLILATLLDHSRHNFVLTTNFDNLVHEAHFYVSKKRPRVFVHEALADLVRPIDSNPTIAKLHRDAGFLPQSDQDSTSHLANSWRNALERCLPFYIPIVIGYAGNDGSLMGFLSNMRDKSFEWGFFWLYHEGSGIPSNEVIELGLKHGIVFVPIAGFDELMVNLAVKLKLDVKLYEKRSQIESRMDSSIADLADKVNTIIADEDAKVSFLSSCLNWPTTVDEAIDHVRTLNTKQEKYEYLHTHRDRFRESGLYLAWYANCKEDWHGAMSSYDDWIGAHDLAPEVTWIISGIWRSLPYTFSERMQDLIARAKRTLERVPSSELVYNVLGLAYHLAQDYDRSDESYEMSLELKETQNVYMNWSDDLIKRSKFTEALTLVQRCGHLARRTTQDLEARYHLTLVRALLGTRDFVGAFNVLTEINATTSTLEGIISQPQFDGIGRDAAYVEAYNDWLQTLLH